MFINTYVNQLDGCAQLTHMKIKTATARHNLGCREYAYRCFLKNQRKGNEMSSSDKEKYSEIQRLARSLMWMASRTIKDFSSRQTIFSEPDIIIEYIKLMSWLAPIASDEWKYGKNAVGKIGYEIQQMSIPPIITSSPHFDAFINEIKRHVRYFELEPNEKNTSSRMTVDEYVSLGMMNNYITLSPLFWGKRRYIKKQREMLFE